MPAPVSSTVWRPPDSREEDDLRSGDAGAERKVERAVMAPDGVLALRGMMIGGGRGPVYGIRIRGKGFCMKDALVQQLLTFNVHAQGQWKCRYKSARKRRFNTE